jgi:hypothetical protein
LKYCPLWGRTRWDEHLEANLKRDSSPSSIDLKALFADPPQVHPAGPGGVWRTDSSCYELIVSEVGPESVTLETGTAVFAAIGTEHTVVTPDAAEGERLREWASRTGTPLDRVRLIFNASEKALPQLEIAPVDLFLVDGGHAFPIPRSPGSTAPHIFAAVEC